MNATPSPAVLAIESAASAMIRRECPGLALELAPVIHRAGCAADAATAALVLERASCLLGRAAHAVRQLPEGM